MLQSSRLPLLISLYSLQKKCFKSITAAIFFICVFFLNSFADEVSFYVPEDHEKYSVIDSFYQQIETTKQTMVKMEGSLIKDKAVREDVWEMKKRYLNYLLENNIRDTAVVLDYCNIVQNHYDTKKQYFKLLLSALEGDIRAKCFIFWKSAREQYSQIQNYVTGLEIETSNASAIQYDTVVQTDMTLDIKEPTVSDVLGLDGLSSENDDPFAGTETALEEVDRGESETTSKLISQESDSKDSSNIAENKLGGLSLKKSDMMDGIGIETETDTLKEGVVQSSFQEDMLKALSVKKSVNDPDLLEEKAETDQKSPEKEISAVVIPETKIQVSKNEEQGGSQDEKVKPATPVKSDFKVKVSDEKQE